MFYNDGSRNKPHLEITPPNSPQTLDSRKRKDRSFDAEGEVPLNFKRTDTGTSKLQQLVDLTVDGHDDIDVGAGTIQVERKQLTTSSNSSEKNDGPRGEKNVDYWQDTDAMWADIEGADVDWEQNAIETEEKWKEWQVYCGFKHCKIKVCSWLMKEHWLPTEEIGTLFDNDKFYGRHQLCDMHDFVQKEQFIYPAATVVTLQSGKKARVFTFKNNKERALKQNIVVGMFKHASSIHHFEINKLHPCTPIHLHCLFASTINGKIGLTTQLKEYEHLQSANKWWKHALATSEQIYKDEEIEKDPFLRKQKEINGKL